jgi:hypothetical protein
VRVTVVSRTGQQREMTADEFYDFVGKHGVPTEELPTENGTKNPNYAATFDGDFRIYISKQGWNYDHKTASFFLPEADARKLVKVGDFWVMADKGLKSVYAYAHPQYRPTLREPGFSLPEDMVGEYFDASDKASFLANWLETSVAGAAIRRADIRVPISTGGSGERKPIQAGGSEQRIPIRAGGSSGRKPIRAGGGPDTPAVPAGGSEERTPIRAGASEQRIPIRAGGSEERTPIRSGGSE